MFLIDQTNVLLNRYNMLFSTGLRADIKSSRSSTLSSLRSHDSHCHYWNGERECGSVNEVLFALKSLIDPNEQMHVC